MSIEPVAAEDLSDGIERNYCSAQRAASRLARARRPRGNNCPDIRRRTPVLLSPGGLRGRTVRTAPHLRHLQNLRAARRCVSREKADLRRAKLLSASVHNSVSGLKCGVMRCHAAARPWKAPGRFGWEAACGRLTKERLKNGGRRMNRCGFSGAILGSNSGDRAERLAAAERTLRVAQRAWGAAPLKNPACASC